MELIRRYRVIETICVVLLGLALGSVLAGPIAAMRPSPPPTVERVTVPTAEAFNLESGCAYAWGGLVYFWGRANMPIKADEPCPPTGVAHKAWADAQRAPVMLAPEER